MDAKRKVPKRSADAKRGTQLQSQHLQSVAKQPKSQPKQMVKQEDAKRKAPKRTTATTNISFSDDQRKNFNTDIQQLIVSQPQHFQTAPMQTQQQQIQTAPRQTQSQQFQAAPMQTQQQFQTAPSQTQPQQFQTAPMQTQQQQFQTAPMQNYQQRLQSAPMQTQQQQFQTVPMQTQQQQFQTAPSQTKPQQFQTAPSQTEPQQFQTAPIQTQQQQPQIIEMGLGQMVIHNNEGRYVVVDEPGESQNPPTSVVDPIPGAAAEMSIEGLLLTVLDENVRVHAQLEHIIKVQEEILSKINSYQPAPSTTNIQQTFPEFCHLDTIEDATDFEGKLSTLEFAEAMMSKLQTVCGPTSGLSGDNVAYKLVDCVFTRRFFTRVCWTGSARKTSKGKFSAFQKTFAFFYQLVRRCDQNYTEVQMKAFFQKIMDNSNRRYQDSLKFDTGKRTSTVRHNNARKKRLPREQHQALGSTSEEDVDFKEDFEMLSDAVSSSSSGVVRSALREIVSNNDAVAEDVVKVESEATSSAQKYRKLADSKNNSKKRKQNKF